MRRRRPILALLVLAASPGVGACGGETDGGSGAGTTPLPPTIVRHASNARTTLTIGSKNFTEQRVLGEVYAEGLKAAGYKVRTDLDLGDQDSALKALEAGRVDGYPEYTGTALVAFFGVPPSRLPHDPQTAYQQARRGFAARGLVAFPPTPFRDSNEVAVTGATARRYGLHKISDLSRVAGRLTLAGSPECRHRTDCLLGLQQVYGLRFKRFMTVPLGKRHTVLANGRADVSIVFTTDPQIRRAGEVLLHDDRRMFPPYNSTLVVRKAVADRAGPDLARTIAILNSQLTATNMQELNARVDLDRQPAAQVAREYLRQTGLVGG
jgi:glycine betaine/choline ABC-type transport system substrate-binding protein